MYNSQGTLKKMMILNELLCNSDSIGHENSGKTGTTAFIFFMILTLVTLGTLAHFSHFEFYGY